MGELTEEPIQEEKRHQKTGAKIAVVGAASPFGRETFRSLSQWDGAEFVLAIDSTEVGKSMRELVGGRAANVVIEEKVGAALDREKCDILLDFSHSTAALQHGLSALKRGVAPILGGVQLSGPDIRELVSASREFNTPVLVAPFFSIGAVLLLNLTHHAAKWMSDVEIVDVSPEHRNGAPSHIARAFAEQIAEGWEKREIHPHGWVEEAENTKTWHDVRMHNVRIKGSPAYQEVHIGAAGECMRIRFDWSDPCAIIDGVKLAVTHIRSMTGVTVGLDKLIFRSGAR